MAVVNTNIGASVAQAALMRNERALNTAMEQLSTGNKINSAGDNASGLAISTRLTSQIRGLDTAIRNANDAMSMVNTAEGALDEITTMMQRMRRGWAYALVLVLELVACGVLGEFRVRDRDRDQAARRLCVCCQCVLFCTPALLGAGTGYE